MFSLSEKLPPSRIFRCLCGAFTTVSFWKVSDNLASRSPCVVSWESLQLGPLATGIILNSPSLLFSGGSATSCQLGLLPHLVEPSSGNFCGRNTLEVKILRPSDLKKICIGYLSECQMLDWKSFALSIKKSLPSCPPVSSTSLLYRVSLALFLKSVVPFWVDALLFLLGNRVLQILGNFLELFL